MHNNNLISIVTMWSEVNKLSRQSLSQSQIALSLGISRDTVRRYQRMSEVPDCEYGEKCQVDYGERWMKTPQGRTVKVYFIVFVLQRSKYKYVYFQNIPFTAKTTVYAHQRAFTKYRTRYKIEAKNADLKNNYGYGVAESYGLHAMTLQGSVAMFASNMRRIVRMMDENDSLLRIENLSQKLRLCHQAANT